MRMNIAFIELSTFRATSAKTLEALYEDRSTSASERREKASPPPEPIPPAAVEAPKPNVPQPSFDF